MHRCDILIAGGGLAGLIAAVALTQQGFDVTLIDPGPRPTGACKDTRSTAYLRPARDLLGRIGLWDQLAPLATPLAQLRIIDTAGDPPHPVDSRNFLPEGSGPFGWNLPNDATRAALCQVLETAPNATLRFGTELTGLLARDASAHVTLGSEDRIEARLVIGADGHASTVRQACEIDVTTTRYGQKALAFEVTHDVPHGDISTEIYASGGAFTLVPLPDRDGRPSSAVVWMEDDPRALDLAARPTDAFSAAATARSTSALGNLRLHGERAIFPVISQRSKRLTARRVALIAEAAHVLPPIGAQGLNSSLADVAALVDLAASDPTALGSDKMLASYEHARSFDICARMAAIDAYNRVCRSGAGWVRRVRVEGLRCVHDLEPVRRAVIRAGLGG